MLAPAISRTLYFVHSTCRLCRALKSADQVSLCARRLIAHCLKTCRINTSASTPHQHLLPQHPPHINPRPPHQCPPVHQHLPHQDLLPSRHTAAASAPAASMLTTSRPAISTPRLHCLPHQYLLCDLPLPNLSCDETVHYFDRPCVYYMLF
jgi:hypothetical protein